MSPGAIKVQGYETCKAFSRVGAGFRDGAHVFRRADGPGGPGRHQRPRPWRGRRRNHAQHRGPPEGHCRLRKTRRRHGPRARGRLQNRAPPAPEPRHPPSRGRRDPPRQRVDRRPPGGRERPSPDLGPEGRERRDLRAGHDRWTRHRVHVPGQAADQPRRLQSELHATGRGVHVHEVRHGRRTGDLRPAAAPPHPLRRLQGRAAKRRRAPRRLDLDGPLGKLRACPHHRAESAQQPPHSEQ